MKEVKELLKKAKKARTIIYKNYPRRENHIRKVTALWGPYFRISFAHEKTGYVTYSVFVKIKDDILTEEGPCQKTKTHVQ